MKSNKHPGKAMLLCGAITLTSFLTAACANPDKPEAANAESKPAPSEMSREERLELRQQMAGKKNLEQVAQTESESVVGEVPQELLDKIMADLEGRTGAARAEFTVKRAEAVQWNDGSMGCGEPGQMYTQAIVPGFWIVIEHDGQAYDYRAAERGYFKLCTDPRSVIEQIRDKEKGPPSGAPVQ